LEAAGALRAHGLAVTVFEASGHLLGREDDALTERLARHLERCRVEVRLKTPATPAGGGAVNGEPYDIVVLAAGVAPNVDLAIDAGIEVGRTGAIRTNDRMETNFGGVYAAGDCAETTHLVAGRPAWIPLGTTANKMGRVAGANAAGKRERFAGVVGASIVRVCGMAVAFTGLSCAEARREGFDPVAARIEGRDRPAYFRGRPAVVELVADSRTRRLLGGTVSGDFGVDGRINVITSALHCRMKAEEFEALDLAYAPPFSPVWDPLLIAAQQLSKLLE
jgi:NADPH-dependent 2,4-dienoyl-CoA reductase/sulfur reductase-like enzyme